MQNVSIYFTKTLFTLVLYIYKDHNKINVFINCRPPNTNAKVAYGHTDRSMQHVLLWQCIECRTQIECKSHVHVIVSCHALASEHSSFVLYIGCLGVSSSIFFNNHALNKWRYAPHYCCTVSSNILKITGISKCQIKGYYRTMIFSHFSKR